MKSPLLRKTLRVLRGIILMGFGAAIIGVAAAIAFHLISHPRRPEQAPPVQEIPVVEVAAAKTSSESVTISGMGPVMPADEVTLQAEVSGRIIALHPEFLEGGIVAEGETLVEIDPRDYELALAASQTQVTTAKANLKMEQGQQEVAQREWELLDMEAEASALDQELALRKPALRQMVAALKAAETQVAQARLNLERTKVKAPSNAVVQAAGVRVGELASSQTQLACLVGTDAYWVEVSVAMDDLKWIFFPGKDGQAGSMVRVISGNGSEREGRVLKLLSDLEANSLLARILVEVRDPLNLSSSESQQAPLLLGEKLQVEIEGRRVEEVFVLPRTALRDGARVWHVDDNNRLAFVRPELTWRGDEVVFCRGLAPGLRIITSDLAAPVEGMALRVLGEENTTSVGVDKEGAMPEDQASQRLADAGEEGRR